jgi:hypothetical protein
MFIAITAGKYCKEISEDSWGRQMEKQTVYISDKMSECDTEAGRFLQHSTGLAAARLACHQFADRVALSVFARPSRLVLGSQPDLF